MDDGQYKLRRQKINLPQEEMAGVGMRQFVMSGNKKNDRMAVYGYVKNEFMNNGLGSPSNDIMDTIAMFYDGNSVVLHLFRSYAWSGLQYKNYHYMMNIDF